MGIRLKGDIYRDPLFQSFKGLDTASSITNMQPGYLRIAKNADITEDGAITTRAGILNALTAAWGSREILFGIQFFVTATTSQNVIFGRLGGAGDLGQFTTTVTSIAGPLSANRPSMIQFNNLLFFFNGVACFLYDGTTTRQIGITPPIAAPSDGGDVPGNLVVGGFYIWVYTYYNSVTGAESSPSPGLGPIAIGGGGGRLLNITPGTPTTANAIRVYRTTANGALLFLDGTTTIGATTYNSIVIDAGLGDELEEDNTRITVWGQPRYAVVSQNRIFTTGFPTNLNRVQFSKIGQSGPYPESFTASGYADCVAEGGIGDLNLGLGQANDVVVVLKQKSIGRLDQLGTINPEISVDSTIYEYKELSRGITCVSHWAQCNVYNNLLWLGKDNIYMTDGKDVTPIANSIRDQFSSIQNINNPEYFSAINDIDNKRVYFTVRKNSSYIQFTGSYTKYPEFYWTTYEPGVNAVTHPGIQARSMFVIDSTTGQHQTYAGLGSGQVAKMNTGTSDNGLGIYFQVRDYPTDYSLPEEKKLFFKDFIHIKPKNDPQYSLRMYSVYDLQDSLSDPFDIVLNADVARWDISRWDVDDWSDPSIRKFYSKHRSAIYEQLQFENFNANQAVSVFGYIKCARPEEFK